jgi:hypothetical protein
MVFGEPNINPRGSRYLFDFIMGISDVSSGLASLDSDPGVDSNSLSDRQPAIESALGPLSVPISGWPSTLKRN